MDVILLALRWYYLYPLSYRDVRDMLAERGITVDATSVHRWVRKFGPVIRKSALRRHRSWHSLTWHVDKTYIRVNGRWCYLSQPLTIITNKAPTYAKVIAKINDRLGPEDAIRHVTRKHLNNRIESDHSALKRLLRPMRSFRDISSGKATLKGIETCRAIRKADEIAFDANLFQDAA